MMQVHVALLVVSIGRNIVLGRNTSNRASLLNNSAAAFAFISEAGHIHRASSSSRHMTTEYNNQMPVNESIIDPEYPGTAVERMLAVRARVRSLEEQKTVLNQPWSDVRRKLLWAGGLRDLPHAVPGRGYTGHSFQDYNHVDLTTMLDRVSDSENDGSVAGIAIGNRLGEGIRTASLPELGPGGSWSTCALGCNKEPPQDSISIPYCV
jgi:hypothetical protein